MNYLLKNNLNNLRGNQLPAALKESHVSVSKYNLLALRAEI